jgi:hypothetical protein
VPKDSFKRRTSYILRANLILEIAMSLRFQISVLLILGLVLIIPMQTSSSFAVTLSCMLLGGRRIAD